MKKDIFRLLIIIWVIFSFFSVFYNGFKVVSDVKIWASLTDGQKRYKIFGDLYNFSLFVNKYTEKNAQILIFSKDGRVGLVTNYYGYPRTIVATTNESEFTKLARSGKYKYIAISKSRISFPDYKETASYSLKDSSDSGYLYKRKW